MKLLLIVYSILIIGVTVVTPFSTFATESAFGRAESIEANAELTIGGASGSIERDDPLIEDIKGVINWVLGLSGLIAVIFLIYGGVLMVTSGGNDEQYKKGFSVLKTAAIGLMIIGFAWFIASLGFWLAQQVGNQAGPAGTEN